MSCYTDNLCGSTPMESSARYELLGLDVDVNEIASVELTDSGTFHYLTNDPLV